MEFFITLLIIFFVGTIIEKTIEKNKKEKKIKNEPLKEDDILDLQLKFEEKIFSENYSILPDSLDGQELYIYKNLMRKWFEKLSTKYRYNNEIIDKIRNDWFDYINFLDKRSLYSFLAMESSDENKTEDLDKRCWKMSQNISRIEESFANMVGNNTAQELEKIKNLDMFDDFDERGNLKK